MLNLTRKPNEFVTLYTSDGPIRVYVVQVNGEQVRLGFEAPENVDILRPEIDDNYKQPA